MLRMVLDQGLSVRQISSPVMKRVPPPGTVQPTETPLANMFAPMVSSKQQSGNCQRGDAHQGSCEFHHWDTSPAGQVRMMKIPAESQPVTTHSQ